MNAYPETLQGRLGALLGDPQSVYGFGRERIVDQRLPRRCRASRGTSSSPRPRCSCISDGDISESVFDQIGHYSFSREGGDGAAFNYRPLDSESVFRNIRMRIGDISLYRYLQVNLGFAPASPQRGRSARLPRSAGERIRRPDARLYPVVDYFPAQPSGGARVCLRGASCSCSIPIAMRSTSPSRRRSEIDDPRVARLFPAGGDALGISGRGPRSGLPAQRMRATRSNSTTGRSIGTGTPWDTTSRRRTPIGCSVQHARR